MIFRSVGHPSNELIQHSLVFIHIVERLENGICHRHSENQPTQLASKIFKSYVLNWAKDEVRLKRNQFGGVKCSGAPHMLVEMYQTMLENLEDYPGSHSGVLY